MSETTTQSKSEQLTSSQEKLDVLDQLLKPEVQESLTDLSRAITKIDSVSEYFN